MMVKIFRETKMINIKKDAHENFMSIINLLAYNFFNRLDARLIPHALAIDFIDEIERSFFAFIKYAPEVLANDAE